MIYKAIAIVGIFISLVGATLLWRSSPSGFALGAYANETLLQQVGTQNRRMRRRQIFAVVLVFVGALMQVPLVWVA